MGKGTITNIQRHKIRQVLMSWTQLQDCWWCTDKSQTQTSLVRSTLARMGKISLQLCSLPPGLVWWQRGMSRGSSSSPCPKLWYLSAHALHPLCPLSQEGSQTCRHCQVSIKGSAEGSGSTSNLTHLTAEVRARVALHFEISPGSFIGLRRCVETRFLYGCRLAW